MRNRVAAPIVIGGSLVVLVATATVAVAWLLWARADDRGRDQDDRAAQTVNEALQNSLGRVLTSLRAAAGLVDSHGQVEPESFQSYAQAVGSIGATDGIALAEIVHAPERARFEAETGRRISEIARPGTLRAAGPRASYVPIVAVWPEDGTKTALLGFDLTSSPERRAAIERAAATRRTMFTADIPFVPEGRGFQAFRPIYPPDAEEGTEPVGFVTTWFSRRVVGAVLSHLPPEIRARVTVGDEEVYASKDAPADGARRSLALGGRRWLVTARGEPVSHASSFAVVVGGAILAAMLGAFTWTRISSEGRLVHAHEAERDARLQAELMERHAARLAAAGTAAEVAEATVGEIEAFGADVVFVWSLREPTRLEALASSVVPEQTNDRFGVYPLDRTGLVADAMRRRTLVSVESGEEYDARYPELAGERRRLGAESLAALPLRSARGEVVGAIFAGSGRPGWLTAGRRPLLGIAEQTGVALERAQLRAEAERAADDSSFLALFGESLERATTVSGRARRIVEQLIDERATFAAVHLVDENAEIEEVASGGSRPPELVDDTRWRAWVEQVVTSGRESSPGPAHPLLVLPLRARGHSLGALTVRIAAGADWTPVVTPRLAREVAGRAALALDNALLYERERGVSHTLQLGLLGGALPGFEGIVVTPAYRAGTAALEVGGDWYDAFSLLSGTAAFVVGDVVGHGLEAAVAMGQLRGAVSALAQTSTPAALLDRLDAFVENVPSAATATLAFVDLDRVTGDFRYACAGHPPPLVVSPDGCTRYLWDGRSAPLGSMLGDRRSDAAGHLADGETLVLYTDGLVERRSTSIDAGLERLADVARLGALGASALADDICDALIDAGSQDDDVCVLTIHRIPTAPMFSRSFRAAPAELADLREHLRGWLGEHAVGDGMEREIVLAVSEAAANAVEHAYDCDGAGIVTVMARFAGDRLEITVRDEGSWREPRHDTERGRGLAIMRAIVDDVSIERDAAATVVRMSHRTRQAAPA